MTERAELGPEIQAPSGRGRRIGLAVLPLLVFGAIAWFLFDGLYLNPREIPSALLDKPVPAFDMPALAGRDGPGLATADLKGEVSLVNVFASWCAACRVEHPLLMRLAEQGVVPVHGLNYKDRPDAAVAWLQRFGDPYDRVGSDVSGRVGIDWGVYGVPETFVVNAEGHIVCKHIGPVMARDLDNKLLPAIAAARAGEPVQC